MKKRLCLCLCLLLLLIPLSAAAQSELSKQKEVARAIFSECITSSMTQYEKAKAVYDYLCDHMSYYDNKRTAYNGLVERIGNCSGYSNSYIFLMRQLGIDCDSYGGKIYGNAHTWNTLKLDGEWYFVDVRFGDLMRDGYLHFCYNYEQAIAMGYTVNSRLKSYNAIKYYEPYYSGALNNAIEAAERKIRQGLNAGQNLIVVDFDNLENMEYVPNRIALKEALPKTYTTGSNLEANVTMEVDEHYLIVRGKYEAVKVKELELAQEEYTFYVCADDLPLKTSLVLTDTITVLPENATNPTLAFFGKHDPIATVNYYTGGVTLRSFGRARVVAATTDKSGVSKNIYINVMDKNARAEQDTQSVATNKAIKSKTTSTTARVSKTTQRNVVKALAMLKNGTFSTLKARLTKTVQAVK